MNIIKKAKKALDLWIEITGIDPNETSFNSSNWHMHDINKVLKESIQLDDSYLTTLMLLDKFVNEYLNDKTFTVSEMMNDYESVMRYLAKCNELVTLLQQEDLIVMKKEFKTWVHKALKHYGITNNAVYEMADSNDKLAFLRRDAFKSIKELKVHQFAKGNSSSNPVKYVKDVHEFWNINSLLKTIQSNHTLSGISLNLIKDNVDTASYFVFGLKNGENVLLLTDKPNYSHPLEKYISRRPGKSLSERIVQHHFPYSLLDLNFDRRGDAYIKASNSKEIVTYQEVINPLKAIKDLAPDEVIWIVLMFSMIEEEYWKKEKQIDKLSYTGEMGKQLINKNTSNEVLITQKTFELPILKMDDISVEKTENDWERKTTNKHQWLEKRYESQVSDDILNVTGNHSTVFLLTEDSSIQELSLKEQEEYEKENYYNENKMANLQKFDATIFGSKEEIMAHQRWVARYNKAVVINQEAKKEYNERIVEIRKWYQDKIRMNSTNIKHAVATGELVTTDVSRQSDFYGKKKELVESNIVTIDLVKNIPYHNLFRAIPLSKLENRRHKCFITGGEPIVTAIFKPSTPQALAKLCNCSIEDLPDVLQYWDLSNVYSGNSNLENIDPMEWVVKDYWKSESFTVIMYLSKSGYNQLRKEVGLPANKIWFDIQEK